MTSIGQFAAGDQLPHAVVHLLVYWSPRIKKFAQIDERD
jgi:hypothetical protein